MNPADLTMIRADAAHFDALGPALAEEFYAGLFELSPTSRQLFPDDLDAQRRKLMDELATLVDLAVHVGGGREAELDRRAADLGRRHVDYGTEPDHYTLVGEALLLALEVTVPGWTDEHRSAWARLYRAVADAMLHGS
ncbi:MAG: globin domain-containing protein [Actinomycetota bacterium]